MASVDVTSRLVEVTSTLTCPDHSQPNTLPKLDHKCTQE